MMAEQTRTCPRCGRPLTVWVDDTGGGVVTVTVWHNGSTMGRKVGAQVWDVTGPIAEQTLSELLRDVFGDACPGKRAQWEPWVWS